KARHRPQTVPQVDGEANVARPQRISAAAKLLSRLAALGEAAHGECAGAFKPNGVACSPIQLEEGIAVAAGAMTEIGAFGERPRGPGESPPFVQQLFKFRRAEGGIGKCRDHAGSAVAMLTEPRWLVVTNGGAP